jgi:hypothetical protein
VFLDYFKNSLLALLWLLLPIFAMAFCHALVNIDAPLFFDPISESQFLDKYWDDVEPMLVLLSGIIAVVVNLLFLIILPCSFGGQAKDVKHKQFLSGFIANTIIGCGFPLFYYFVYGLDNLTMWAALFPVHLVAFPVTLIVGSRFITKAFRKGFWF